MTGTRNHLMPDKKFNRLTLLVTLTQSFRSQFFFFFRSGTMPTCGGLTLSQRFPIQMGTSLSFNLTWMSPHTTQNIITLTLTFAPANKNSLAWVTLHFAILHHCINSVFSCNQNTHCLQGPKSDYTHVHNHPLLILS